MKNLKKLPTKQLEKFSNVFTQLGLVLVLFIVYITLEHQTEQKAVADYKPDKENVVYLEPDQIVKFVKEVKTKPKVKLPKKQVFNPDEFKKGDNDIKENPILDLPDEDITIVDIDSVKVVKLPNEDPIIEDVPFILIEDAPVFKGCEGLSKQENKKCFDKKMKQFVQRNFDVDLANELGLRSGIHKIQTQFIIDKKGNVVDVSIRAPHNRLKKEANRLIKKLPKFIPGKQRDKPVKVRYTLPIAFRVE